MEPPANRRKLAGLATAGYTYTTSLLRWLKLGSLALDSSRAFGGRKNEAKAERIASRDASSSGRKIPHSLEAELNRLTIRSLRVASPMLGLLFIIYAFYVGSRPVEFAELLFWVTVSSAGFYLLVTVAVINDSLRHDWAHRVGFVVCVVLLLNRILQHYVLTVPVDTASVMAVPIMGALILQSLPWLALLLGTSLASWSLIAFGRFFEHFSSAWPLLLGGTVAAFFIQGIRIVSSKRLFRLRLVEDERQILAEDKKRYELAVDGANDGLWFWDLRNDQIFFSPRWKSMLGYQNEEISSDPKEWLNRLHADHASSFCDHLSAHLRGETKQFETKYRIRHRNGNYCWMLVRGLTVRDSDGKPTAIAGSQTNISNLIEVESRLIHDAMHDQLTGLPNRTHLMRELHTSHKRGGLYAVLFLDLDRFKMVNDSLGHAMGDQLLVAAAKRLTGCLRSSDLVARFGGDEFVVLLRALKTRKEAERSAARIQKTLGEPFALEGQSVTTTGSIGIAFREYGTSPEDLLRNADIAMYDAKREKGSVSVFHPDMGGSVLRTWEFQKGIREAIDKQELFLHYQPQYSIDDLRVVGVEALLRWRRANGELCPPAELIPQAEEIGMIGEIGEWVLDAACKQYNLWGCARSVPFRIAVNVSVLQLQDRGFPKIVEQIAGHAGLPPGCLEIEVTESVLVGDEDVAFHNLCALANSGIRISVDDFGTGYSCLEYLKRLPLNTLKFSQSLMSGIQNDPKSAALLEGLILTAHRLDLEVIAEGVETEEQLSILRSFGCDVVQGFLLSPPVDAKVLTKMLQSGPTLTKGEISARSEEIMLPAPAASALACSR